MYEIVASLICKNASLVSFSFKERFNQTYMNEILNSISIESSADLHECNITKTSI